MTDLKKKYLDPKTGLKSLKTFAEENHVNVDTVKEAIQNEDAHQLNVYSRRTFPRRKVNVSGLGVQYQCDLADMQKYKAVNDGVSYLLVLMDCFSRYAWVAPLKSKSASSIATALAVLLNATDKERKPNAVLQTDNGSEFYNSTVEGLLIKKDVRLVSSEGGTKAQMVERLIRTLKMRISRLWDSRAEGFKYIDKLNDLVYNYNHTKHSSIMMPPVDVTSSNEKEISERLNPTKNLIVPDTFPKLKEGQSVRRTNARHTFPKESGDQRWSHEIFTIYQTKYTNPPTYILKDAKGRIVKGMFYEPELQVTTTPKTYKIEKILDTRVKGKVKQSLVKWLGYADEYNEWVNDRDIAPQSSSKSE